MMRMGNSNISDLLDNVVNLLTCKEFVGWAGSILGVALTCAFKNVRVWLSNAWKRFKSVGKAKDHTIDHQTMGMYELINRELLVIMTENEAARATVWQFHNGETFSMANPAFKMRTTYEQCAYGVQSDKAGDEAILVSRMMEIVGPLMNPEYVVQGVEDVTPANNKAMYAEDSVIRTLRINRDALEYCRTKFLMNMNGIHHAYLMLLTSLKGHPIGVLTIQHMVPGDIKPKDREEMLLRSYASVRNIQFALDKFNK